MVFILSYVPQNLGRSKDHPRLTCSLSAQVGFLPAGYPQDDSTGKNSVEATDWRPQLAHFKTKAQWCNSNPISSAYPPLYLFFLLVLNLQIYFLSKLNQELCLQAHFNLTTDPWYKERNKCCINP